MADWAKIALKVGLIAGVMAGIWAVFTQITFPTVNFSGVFSTIGLVFAFFTYWCPVFPVIWNATLAMGALLLSLYTFRFGSIAIRWLFKVNE